MHASITPIINKAKHLANLVKLEHTVFALPFALSALLLAQPWGAWPAVKTTSLVLLAMLGGRTYAMGLNRLADAHFDALNPRTAQRELPAGKVSRPEAWGLSLAALALMVLATLPLPLLCIQLLPVAVVLLSLYSYTKRFTSLCHVVLGLALGSSAIGGWLAHTGNWSYGLPIYWGLAVGFWVCGFDILYACQDEAFDKANGLLSIPAKLGVAKAIVVSRLSHTLSVACLALFGLLYTQQFQPVGIGFWVGVSIMSGLLVWQHRLVSATDLSRVNVAFFTVNGVISVLMFTLILLDRVVNLLWQ
jgi:4-hydroxybenzoate polyprenyltransferase